MMRATRMLNAATLGCVMSLGLGLAACDGTRADKPGAPASQPAAFESPGAANAPPPVQNLPEKKSIIRPDIEKLPAEAPVLKPQTLVVPFPVKGARPDETGIALIDGLIVSPVFQAGGPITIWGHSDSAGSDAANLTASRRRAETVSTYLQARGAAKARITVISIGEGRPIAPNRKLDGSEDTEGRRKNRRVEIRVDPPLPSPEAVAVATESHSPN